MKRNSTTLYLESPGSITPVPWVNNDAPELSGFSDPTLGVLQKAWADFLASGEELEILPDIEPIALPPEPNPAAFRAALAQTPSWLAWAESLSSVSYTNLTIAAANDNWAEAEAIYGMVAAATPPTAEARAAWQQLADEHAIPITF